MENLLRWLVFYFVWFVAAWIVGLAASCVLENRLGHRLAQCTLGRHDYILEEYDGSLYCTRSAVGGAANAQLAIDDLRIGIRCTSIDWQATTIAIPYVALVFFLCAYPTYLVLQRYAFIGKPVDR